MWKHHRFWFIPPETNTFNHFTTTLTPQLLEYLYLWTGLDRSQYSLCCSNASWSTHDSTFTCTFLSSVHIPLLYIYKKNILHTVGEFQELYLGQGQGVQELVSSLFCDVSYFPLQNSSHSAPLVQLFISLSLGLFDGLSKRLASKTVVKNICHFEFLRGSFKQKTFSLPDSHQSCRNFYTRHRHCY